MSLKASEFFNIQWIYPIPGVYISFDEPQEGDESPEQPPTHSIEIIVDTVGLKRILRGTMTVKWGDEEFAKVSEAAFANILNSSITDKLLPYVKLVGTPVIAKL